MARPLAGTATGLLAVILPFTTSDAVRWAAGVPQITSAALGAAFNSSNLNATAQANVLSQLDAGGTLDAAGKVTVGAASGNFATASMENASGAIINLGSVGSNPIADAKGHTEANLLGNVVGPGSTAGANSILLAAEGCGQRHGVDEQRRRRGALDQQL